MAKVAIQPRILKGFRDQLPEIVLPRNKMIQQVSAVFQSFGFVPIDTPALEFADILLGKGSAETDKQLYRFTDNGGRDVALRFDLTIPLARFAAMHIAELGSPFRRYHIAPVWRAEKPQRGRYREFIQCDFDIIGTTSAISDAEILLVINQSLSTLQVNHRIRFNNRLLLNGLLTELNAEDKAVAVLRAIDKLEKIGEQGVRSEIIDSAGLSSAQVDRIFSYLALTNNNAQSNATSVDAIRDFFKDSTRGGPIAENGLTQIEQILAVTSAAGLTDDSLRLDLSIARGLDYYTSSVFETVLTDLPDIGSVCSGGRYDNLAGLYSTQQLPGVGASIGLDRLLAALEELGRLESSQSCSQVLVTLVEDDAAPACAAFAQRLRNAGIATETFPSPAKLATQLKYANKKGIPFAVIAGKDELSKGTCSIKNLVTGEQLDAVLVDQAAEHLRNK